MPGCVPRRQPDGLQATKVTVPGKAREERISLIPAVDAVALRAGTCHNPIIDYAAAVIWLRQITAVTPGQAGDTAIRTSDRS